MLNKVSIRTHLVILVFIISIILCALALIGVQSIYSNHDALSNNQHKYIEPINKLYSFKQNYTLPIQEQLKPLIKPPIEQQSESMPPLLSAEQILQRLHATHDSFILFCDNWDNFSHIYSEKAQSLLFYQYQLNLKEIRKKLIQIDLPNLKLDPSFYSQHFQLLKDLSSLNAQLEQLIYQFVESDFNSLADYYQKMHQRYPVQLALMGLFLCLCLALLWCFSWPFVKMLLSSLNAVADELKSLVSDEADLTKRIGIKQDNEIGKISLCFNQLMDNLLELTKRVQRSGLQVFGSANSISASSKLLENTVSHFSTFTNDIVSTAKQISGTSQELVRTMSHVTQVADNTAHLANNGKKGLEQIEATIGQMEEAFKAIASKLGTISEKAANITTVVTTITKIADQTNLLSLNASIEAEKAGEVGLGFAVIARETRRLADQTAVATLDIEKMVTEMKTSVNSGVISIENFAKQLNRYVNDVRQIASQQAQIIEHVQTLTPQFEGVHKGMQSQSQSAQQISEAMMQLSEVALKANEALKQSNYAIEQLNAAARGLQKEVSRFKLVS